MANEDAENDVDRRLVADLFALPLEERQRVLRCLPDRQLRELCGRWRMWAHDGQAAPAGDWRV